MEFTNTKIEKGFVTPCNPWSLAVKFKGTHAGQPNGRNGRIEMFETKEQCDRFKKYPVKELSKEKNGLDGIAVTF
jgi:hypothetical protein